MAEKTIVNYELLEAISKKFNNESEMIAQLTAKLRQKVFHMQKEWIGLGSDSFFDEMEMEILPSMKRLSDALLFTNKTVVDVAKIYHDGEEQSRNLFKGNFEQVNLGSTDFGASQFNNLGAAGGGAGAGPDLSQTDFGASQFEGAAAGGSGAGTADSGQVDLGTTDYGAGQFDQGAGGESSHAADSSSNQEGSSAADSSGSSGGSSGGASGGGSGGGSSGGSAGASGDLNEMGSGIKQEGSSTSAGGSGSGSAGGGGQQMADHIYQSAAGDTSTPSSGSSGAGSGAGGGAGSGSSTSTDNQGGTAAGVAGVVAGAGAAAGGAARVIKGKKDEE
ncbi:MAG: hypothetical protein BGO78_11235 [Chloroflexi bacterium 44-23]|nr:MAG: hypothetical protein BGO78_11235 [Chloroflexi bacterium 44-23]